jgi:hypothetical protein
VFLGSSLPENASPEDVERFNGGQGGHLRAALCIDKSSDELGSFEVLNDELKPMDLEWQIVLISCIAGENNVAPTPEDVAEPLIEMAIDVQRGQNLDKYLAFDCDGDAVMFGA